jgi:Flp pilus assembly pilin Flp
MFRRFLADDSGGEILEYALIAGVLLVAAIAVLLAFSGRLVGRWNELNNIM